MGASPSDYAGDTDLCRATPVNQPRNTPNTRKEKTKDTEEYKLRKNLCNSSTLDEVKFVRDGKAEVLVRLKELKPEAIAELRKLGFEVITEISSANAIVGRIEIGKITSLAELDVVTFISPQMR